MSPRLSQVQPFQRVKHFGTLSSDGYQGIGQVPEWTIGHVEVDATENTVTISPVDIAPNTMKASIAAIAALADDTATLR